MAPTLPTTCASRGAMIYDPESRRITGLKAPSSSELLGDARWIVVLPPTATVVAPPIDFFRITLLKPGVSIGEHQIQAKMVGRG